MSVTAKETLEKKCQQAEAELGSLQAELSAAIREAKSRSKGFEEAIAILGRDESAAYVRKKLEDKIKKEQQAVEAVRAELADVEGRLSAYRETLKLLEKGVDESGAPELRPTSELYRIREAIRKVNRPMTLTELLTALDVPDTPEKRNSIRGSIGRYARDSKIFVQTAPNTFGLLELNHNQDIVPIEL